MLREKHAQNIITNRTSIALLENKKIPPSFFRLLVKGYRRLSQYKDSKSLFRVSVAPRISTYSSLIQLLSFVYEFSSYTYSLKDPTSFDYLSWKKALIKSSLYE